MNDKKFIEIMESLKNTNKNLHDNLYIYFGYEDKYLLILDSTDIYVSINDRCYFDYTIADDEDMMNALIEDWDYIQDCINRDIFLQEQVAFIYYE